jgi:hypothetical protein
MLFVKIVPVRSLNKNDLSHGFLTAGKGSLAKIVNYGSSGVSLGPKGPKAKGLLGPEALEGLGDRGSPPGHQQWPLSHLARSRQRTGA